MFLLHRVRTLRPLADQTVIAAQGLTKRYGRVLALDRLDLTVPDGAVLGLLGPNGSGKSTLVRLVMGFIFPDAGRLDRGVSRPDAIGFMPERPAFPHRMRARSYLALNGQLSGLSGAGLRQAVEARLGQMGLESSAGWPIGAYSKGMLQRLALAAALIGDPRLLILDEPMSGLDPLWQKAFRETVRLLQRAGTTVVFSTHRLEDIVDLCTHVAIIHRGRLVRGGSLNEVLPLRDEIRIRVGAMTEPLRARLRGIGMGVTVSGDEVVLAGQALASAPAVLRLVLDEGAEIIDLRRQRMSLEEVYLASIASREAAAT